MNEFVMKNYGSAILEAFDYLLENYPEVFVIGQGLWSPWYVGNSMTGLDKRHGVDRVIDTPVAESACTGVAVGASLAGMKPIIVHPRMDFMLYAMDAIVNQAAKWSSMFGGQSHPGVTIRAIINRGGEQGAQHSQSLHAWFAHIPGLRVVMPATPSDARDLLIASVLSPDPVVYIDDRWLYSSQESLGPVVELDLKNEGPVVRRPGSDVTIVASGYSSKLAIDAAEALMLDGVDVEVVDLRVINPFCGDVVATSVAKTGRLIVVDGGWRTCGFGAEVIASVAETIPFAAMRANPIRISLEDSPAPTATAQELHYYPSIDCITTAVHRLCS